MTVLFGLVLLVAAEIAALVAVADQIGALDAVGLLVLVSLSGPWLVRRAGFGTWRRTTERLAAGDTPSREFLDGFLLLTAGLLICIPGFVTDVLGLLLLLPPVRAVVRRRASRRAARSLLFRFGPPGRMGGLGGAGSAGRRSWDGEVVDAGSHQPGPDGPPGPGGWGRPAGDLPAPGPDVPGGEPGSGR